MQTDKAVVAPAPLRTANTLRTGYGPILVALVVGLTIVMLARTLSRTLPLSNAGLYLTMSDALVAHHFALPWRVPWYARGGVPFAYPPLAFYVMAFFTHTLDVPRMRYLEIAPPLFTAGTAIPLYLFYRDLLGSGRQALMGVVVSCTGQSFLYMYVLADGSVRAFAAFWMPWSLFLGWRTLQRGSVRLGFLASICLAATLASHLENGFFAFMSLGLFALFHRFSWPRVTRAAIVAAGGIVLSAPWWLLVLHRFGTAVFVSALGSHENPSSTNTLSATGLLVSFIAAFIRLLISMSGDWWLYLFAFVGLVVAQRYTRRLLIVWLVASLLLLPHGDRHWAVVMGAAAPVGIDAVVLWAARSRARARRLLRRAVPAILLAIGIAHVGWYMASQPPGLTADDLRVTDWLRVHTSPTARVFVTQPYEREGEWYPYLTHRVPSIPLWGTEFNGQHDRQLTIFYKQVACTERGSMPCILSLIQRYHIPRGYLVEHPTQFARHDAQPLRSAGWRVVYRTPTITVWKADRL
jgi:hypothetical protein